MTRTLSTIVLILIALFDAPELHANEWTVSSENFRLLHRSSDNEVELWEELTPSANILPHRIDDSDDPREIPDRRWYKWVPDGLNQAYSSEDCSSEHIEKALKQFPDNPYQQGKALKLYIERCEQQIGRDRHKDFTVMFKYSQLFYPIYSNPHIKKVKVSFADGTSTEGFLAIKEGAQPRPLVIVKCGIFCNASDSTVHRNALMHLFDESPFHVLSLANLTSTRYVRDNETLAIGGFDEGRQIVKIAQMMHSEESPLRDQISSIHVVGVSLGGHGALYSALYNSQNFLPQQRPIQSVMAVCPVVSLERSTTRLFSKNPVGIIATFWTVLELKKVLLSLPILGDLLDLTSRPRQKEVFDAVSLAALRYYQQRLEKSPWDMKPFDNVELDNREQLWYVNEFVEHSHLVDTPTLVVAANDDVLVKTKDNALPLAEKHDNDPNSFVNVIRLNQGNHCAFSVANGWRNMSTLMREYILSHSPEFASKAGIVREARIDNYIRELRWPFNYKLWEDEVNISQEWQAKKNDDQMELTLVVFTPYRSTLVDNCSNYLDRPHAAPRVCYYKVRAKVPLAALPLPESMQAAPQTKGDADQLTRIANVRLRVHGDDGKSLIASDRFPTFVQFVDFNP